MARVIAMNKVVNLLGWLGTLAVGVSLFLRFQWMKAEWTPYSWHAAIAGLVLILLYIAAQWRDIGKSFERRQTRLGTIAAGSVLVVLGILVAVNYLSTRRNHRWDLTANKQFSLSDQSRQLLEKLDQPVKATVFAKDAEFDSFRDRLDGYEYAGKGKFTTQYVNPDKDPVRAQQNQVQAYGTVVFAYKDRTERVVGSDEQQLTNALIKVMSGEQRKVYFLEGHGERDTDEQCARRLLGRLAGPRVGELQDRDAAPGAEGRGAGRRERARRGRAEDRPAPAGGGRDQEVPRSGRQAVLPRRAGADEGRPSRSRTSRHSSRSGASRSGTTSSSTPTRSASCSAPANSHRWPRATRRTRSRRTSA